MSPHKAHAATEAITDEALAKTIQSASQSRVG